MLAPMTLRFLPILLLSALLGSATSPVWAEKRPPDILPPAPSDVAHPVIRGFELPEIGKWMIASDGRIASWLGLRYRGKELREPINVIVYDAFAKTGEEAYARLEAAAAVEEFEMRPGHSVGYSALVGGIAFEQLPLGKGHAISDGPFEFANNHGRIFGPLRWKEGWLFTAAFSREHTDVVTKVKHHYLSFNRARDAFAWALDREGTFAVAGFISLANAIVGSPEIGTGDHDGLAVFLSAVK
jgi:hypothetical protein